MLELGAAGADLHRGLNEAVKTNRIDVAFCTPMMRNLWDALSSRCRGGYAGVRPNSNRNGSPRSGPGGVIMVKGSLGSRMETIVNALERAFPTKPRPMLRRRKAV
jgi:UDP-N-acetylmuramoyl-tripeptide--D-alanyl-D-alanine ligase